MLMADTNYRLKFERQHENFNEYHRLNWLGPYATMQEAADAPTSAFALIQAQHFLHEVVCPDGCSGRGCCVADGQCQCEAGYGGASCELLLETCPEGPSGELTAGGLKARYYNTRSFENLVVERVDGGLLPNNVLPSNVNRDDFSVLWIGRVQALHTGMHVFGHTTNSRAVARITISGVRLYEWEDDWATFMFLVAGQSYEIAIEFRSVVQNPLLKPTLLAGSMHALLSTRSFNPLRLRLS